MKKRLLPLLLALALALTGCASMLERSYESATAHVDRPTTGEDPSILRVENYRELVSAVLYLVSQGEEEGTIQLHDYAGSVETDLPAACLEVTTEDPLGAYAVDYIKHEYTQVMSYYQAAVSIRYRRSQDQVRSMVHVTGSSAIRSELQGALSAFREEVVLRVAYFAEDEDSIRDLVRQAYYDVPAYAQGMPQVEVALYPESGRERVVEILLTYPLPAEELQPRSGEAALAAGAMAEDLAGGEPAAEALRVARYLTREVELRAEGATAYDALVEGHANDEGLALAFILLCRQPALQLECQVVEGTVGETPRFWNSLTIGKETRYLDLLQDPNRLYTAEELVELGYTWPGAPVPPEETPEVTEEIAPET